MRVKGSHIFLVICCFACFLTFTEAQTLPVKVKFEVNGQETNQTFRILLYADGVPSEPTISDDGQFYVPALNVKKVNVRFVSGKYDLVYEGVYLNELRGRLVFGVNEKPSNDETACASGKKLISNHYLEFHPEDAEGTAIIISVCK